MDTRKIALTSAAVAWMAVVGWTFRESFLPPNERTNAPVSSHDFGKVLLVGGRTLQAHAFHYRNDLGVADTIIGVRSSCSCSSADIERKTIDVNELIDVPVKLELTKPGFQKAQVWLLLERAGVKEFTVSATAIPDVHAKLVESTVRAGGAGHARLNIIGRGLDGTSPQSPIIEADGCLYEVNEWTLARSGSLNDHIPARWHTTVIVRPQPDTVQTPALTEVVVRLPHDVEIGRATIHW